MSESKLYHTITRELEMINEEIDLRIIKGFPYKREAKRHKLLVSMLHDVSQRFSNKKSFNFLSYLL